jgi:hypothetical protein
VKWTAASSPLWPSLSKSLPPLGWQQSRRRLTLSGRHAPLSPRRTPGRSLSIPPALTARCCASALTFPPNRKARSSTSSTQTTTSSCGNP